MSSRRAKERRTNLIVGVFVLALGSLGTASLFTIAVSEGWGVSKERITAHFRTVSGLTHNSKVQLAGKEIGKVVGLDFISARYECNPATEDNGAVGVRTDDCDPFLFCSEEGFCANLEAFTGNEEDYRDQSCVGDTSCAEGSVCVTAPFRGRYRRVGWKGRDGWCVRYNSDHPRVEVSMEIDGDKFDFIREDSRATVQSNGVLGDQLINITVGRAAAIAPGGRIGTSPSIMEELNLFKGRLDDITEKVDRGLAGLAGLFSALNNENTKKDLQQIIGNVNELSGQIKEGKGLVGALFNDRQYKEEFGLTMRSLRHSASQLDGALTSVNREVEPAVKNVSRATSSIAELVDTLNDPKNNSVLARAIRDDQMGEDVQRAVGSAADALGSTKEAVADVQSLVAEISESVRSGEGTLGKLIKDPKAYDDLVKILGNVERNNVIKKLVRFVLEKDEMSDSGRPSDRPEAPAATKSDPK